MRVICSSQRNHEWFQARLGRVTASSAWKAIDVLAKKSKNGVAADPSGKQLSYMREKAIEILTGEPAEHFVSRAMDKGREYEPKAIERYKFENDIDDLTSTGFVLHPTMDRFGASPDRLRKRGGVEAKCPTASVHMDYWESYRKSKTASLEGNALAYAVIPDDYMVQVQSNIVCCEADWWDWISYVPPIPEDGYPAFPEKMRMLQIRVLRDEVKIAEIESGVNSFNERLLDYVENMQRLTA